LPSDTPSSAAGAQQAGHSLRRRTVRGVRLAAAGYALSQAGNLIAYLVLVRLLTPRAFGLYAAGSVITGVGGLFAESGMLAALIKREDRLEEAASTAFASLSVTGTGLALASLAASPLVALAFHNPTAGEVAAALSGWLLVRALTIVPDALLQRRLSFARRVVVDPLGVLAYAAAAIPLAAGGAGVWAMVAGAYASILVEAAFSWVAAGWRPRRSEMSVSLWRELAAFARPLVAGEVLRRLTGIVDTIALGRARGPSTLGQYRNGLMLAQQPGGAFGAVAAYVVLPAFARISGDARRLDAAAREAYRIAYAAIVPVAVACVPLGVPVAVTVLGSRWRPAGHVIAGLCGFVLGGVLLSIGGELMKAAAALRLTLVVQGMWFALTAAGVTVAAFAAGAVGVAVAVSAGACLTAAYATAMLGRALGAGAGALFGGLWAPLAASGAMLAALLPFASAVGLPRHGEAVRVLLLACEIVLGASVYGALLLALDRRLRALAARGARSRLRGRRRAGA